MRNVYDDNVVITVIKTNSLPLTLGHKGRRLLQAEDVSVIWLSEIFNCKYTAIPLYFQF